MPGFQLCPNCPEKRNCGCWMLMEVPPCQSRLVKHETPYFLWTIKRDVVDYHNLNSDQMLNHYGKTGSFTTKVGGGCDAGLGEAALHWTGAAGLRFLQFLSDGRRGTYCTPILHLPTLLHAICVQGVQGSWKSPLRRHRPSPSWVSSRAGTGCPSGPDSSVPGDRAVREHAEPAVVRPGEPRRLLPTLLQPLHRE